MALGTTQASVETKSDFGDDREAVAKRYIAEIDLYDSLMKDWRERAKKIVDRYRDERKDAVRNVPKYNLLWSNIQTTLPIYYAKTPKADVQRRFKDQDAVGRLACEIAERSLDYAIESDDKFDRAMRQGTEDFALVGRGATCWQRYVPHFKGIKKRIDVELLQAQPDNPEAAIAENGTQISNDMEAGGEYRSSDGERYTREQVTQDDNGFFVEGEASVLDYEEIIDDYINWDDLGHNSGARTWDEVYIVWRRCYLTRDELHARFDATIGKDKVDELPLDFEPKDLGKYDDSIKNLFRKACVYEMWDKSCRKVIWIHKGCEIPLDERKDPLGLTDFFPLPKPLFATTTNNTLVPIPDFAMYQDQAGEIDNITSRIAIIEKAIRVRGLYPGQVDAIRQLLTNADDNDMIALDQAQASAIMQGGADLSKIVYFWPVDILVRCLEVLIKLREQLIQDIYQITGFGDILRGVTEARETATTSQLKSQWGSLRVRDRQKEIQRYARDTLRLKFEIIFNHYEAETIWLTSSASNIPDIQKDQTVGQTDPMTGKFYPHGKLFDDALALLRDSALRAFRVDIETDSTVAPDDTAEKQSYTEFLGAVGAFFGQVAPIVQQAPSFAPFVGELLLKGARLYRSASSVESTLETAVQAFMQQPPPPPQGKQVEPPPSIDPQEIALRQETEQTKRMKINADRQKNDTDAILTARQQQIDMDQLRVDVAALQREKPQTVQ